MNAQMITALITPFAENGAIDFKAMRKLITWQQEMGISHFLALGTTGEAHALSEKEKEALLAALQELKEISPFSLMVGCTAQHSEQVLNNIQQAKHFQADAVLIAPPAYIKPSQEDLLAYFKEIASTSPLPIILYNHPERTGVRLSLSLLQSLSSLPAIIGMKEVETDIERTIDLMTALPREFILYSGDDWTMAFSIRLGFKGGISVLSNAMPREMLQWMEVAGYNLEESYTMQRQLRPYLEYLRQGPNPSMVKSLLKQLGHSFGDVKTPLKPTKQLLKAHEETLV